MTATDFVKKWEGLRLKAYPDPASDRAVHLRLTGIDDPSLDGSPFTIGYGATGDDITEYTVWTQAQADSDLTIRLSKIQSEIASVTNIPLTPNQLSALTSFVYNVGLGNFKSSRLLKKLNGNDLKGAAEEFKRWANAKGKPNPGLLKRRTAEKTLFLTT